MKSDTVKQRTGQPKTAMMLQCLRLDYLYTEFILHTLLASTSGISREKLLSTAHEIVHTVLLPTRMRDLLHNHRADMEWAVSDVIPEIPEQAQVSETYTYASWCSMPYLVPAF